MCARVCVRVCVDVGTCACEFGGGPKRASLTLYGAGFRLDLEHSGNNGISPHVGLWRRLPLEDEHARTLIHPRSHTRHHLHKESRSVFVSGHVHVSVCQCVSVSVCRGAKPLTRRTNLNAFRLLDRLSDATRLCGCVLDTANAMNRCEDVEEQLKCVFVWHSLTLLDGRRLQLSVLCSPSSTKEGHRYKIVCACVCACMCVREWPLLDSGTPLFPLLCQPASSSGATTMKLNSFATRIPDTFRPALIPSRASAPSTLAIFSPL